MLIYGHGALSSVWANVVRKPVRRNEILLMGPSNSCIWVPRSLLYGPGVISEQIAWETPKLSLKGSSRANIWLPMLADMWSWSSPALSEQMCKRNHWRNVLALKGSSKSNIWVHMLLICKPGALKSYLSKCSKRNPRRNKLVLQGLVKSTLWMFRVLVWGHGFSALLERV